MRILFCILLFPISSIGQNTIGLPDVINYTKQAYGAGLQNWEIRQDKNGIIYIANNEGLLSFDGHYWNLYPLPNKTIVRSVEIGPDNKIYVGGQDELGYFSPSENGQLQYTSLIEKIPQKDRSFGDVWDISSFKKSIFFRTPAKIFQVINETVSVYHASSEWSYMGASNDRLFAHDYKKGLLTFENNIWAPLPVANILSPTVPVTGIFPIRNDSTLITTLKNGLYILSGNRISPLQSTGLSAIVNDRIYAATPVSPEWMALATSNSGVHIVDAGGHLIQRFSRTEGLQNNNVLCVFLDKQGNLWLGLDNGIDFIAYNSAIKRIIPDSRDGSGYTAIIHNNTLYSGTSGGLFYVALQQTEDLSFSKGTFKPVSNTAGQTWGLSVINDQLLLGHHEGAFHVSQHTAKAITPAGAGYWNFVPLSPVYPTERIIAGNYKGLAFFHYSNNTFSPAGTIPGFEESSRFVVTDRDDNIWISHPYHGVYRATPVSQGNYTMKHYTGNNGLPSTLNNHIYKIKNKVVAATERGVYSYNPGTDRFEPDPFYKKILGTRGIRYLKEDTEGNVWFIHEKKLGVADMTTTDTVLIYLPELDNKLVSGFEYLYPVNENNIFVGGERGFFHINYSKYKKNIPSLRVLLRAVTIVHKRDSLLFGGYYSGADPSSPHSNNMIPGIANKWGTIRFEYASPLFGQQSNLEYSYRLKGLEDAWSDWSPKTEKEYTHLPAGSYFFEVKVRNNLGNESAPAGYAFKVLPPWHQSTIAYVVYFLLLCAGLYYLYKWQQKKFVRQQARYEEEQNRLLYLHQLEINKAENELIALRNEKLQAEIDFKNSELATSAMHLVQKGELLSRIRGELNQVMKGLDNEKAVNELKKMIKVLGEEDKMDKDWEHFAQHFDKVHRDFVAVLKEKHPAITPNELKLSAYLRMNLSTKEIAQLMNISVRGVEISRYRLRKKLGIKSDVTLFDYLINI